MPTRGGKLPTASSSAASSVYGRGTAVRGNQAQPLPPCACGALWESKQRAKFCSRRCARGPRCIRPRNSPANRIRDFLRAHPGSTSRVIWLALSLAQGVSQGQLARKLGISQPAIAKIEALRVKNLRFRTLSRAAQALGGSLQMTIVEDRPRISSTKQIRGALKGGRTRKEAGR